MSGLWAPPQGIVTPASAYAALGVFNAKAFGVKADGVTDDTTAWEKAVNALLQNGGILLHPGGNSMISGPALNIVSGSKAAWLMGLGIGVSRITQNEASADAVFTSGYLARVTDLQLIGAGIGTATGSGLHVSSPTNTEIGRNSFERVQAEGFNYGAMIAPYSFDKLSLAQCDFSFNGSDGVHLTTTAASQGFAMRDCVVDNNGGLGVNLIPSTMGSTLIEGLESVNNAGNALFAESCLGLTITAPDIEGVPTGQSGIYLANVGWFDIHGGCVLAASGDTANYGIYCGATAAYDGQVRGVRIGGPGTWTHPLVADHSATRLVTQGCSDGNGNHITWTIGSNGTMTNIRDLDLGGRVDDTTLAGTSGGSFIWVQDNQGTGKRFIGRFQTYENTTATAQTITFPTAFTYTPHIVYDASGGASVSTTTLTLPASMGSAVSGVITVEGI